LKFQISDASVGIVHICEADENVGPLDGFTRESWRTFAQDLRGRAQQAARLRGNFNRGLAPGLQRDAAHCRFGPTQARVPVLLGHCDLMVMER
jgi:hypothetical protein